MRLMINGEPRDVPQVENLRALLEELRIHPQTVVVEYNEQVVPSTILDKTAVSDGGKVEIVRFVAGGGPEEDGARSRPPKKATRKRKKAGNKKAAVRRGPKNLVIVESPAKAKTINKFLGRDFQVEASFGHVRDLPKSKMGVDVANQFAPHYIVISRARKTVNNLKKLAAGKEGIFLAPDPDREGEAISWHLSHIFREMDSSLNIRRVVFNEITRDAVQQAFEHPREIQQNLVDAQQARRILDRIVGYELSPLLWKKVGRGLSAGRVQSVALRLIVEREREIRKFVPQEYWTIEAKLSPESGDESGKIFKSKLEKIGGEKADLKNKEEARVVRDEILKSSFQVDKVEKKERKRRPQAPFTTSKLQQEAYNRLGFPAAKTMRIAQGLYEGIDLGEEGSVGLITYMRTDSVNIAVSAQKEAAEFIQEKYGKDYLPPSPPVYKSKKGAQEAHEAVRPTSARREPEMMRSVLSDDEYKLYGLIWKKFLSSQMTPAVDEHLSVLIQAGENHTFKTTGRRNLFPGFAAVYGETVSEEDDAQADLPHFTQGQRLTLRELMGYQHFTKPPGRFNDASLVKTLEEKGIGRPSTYAPTIHTLLSRDYVNRRGGALMPTELGETVMDLLVEHFPRVLNVEFTALMEEELDKIEEGAMEWVHVLKDFYTPFEVNVEKAREMMKNVRVEAVPTEHICDVCGKPMVVKMGRFGKFLACSGFPDCKYTRSMPTGFLCPQEGCGGELVKRMSKQRRMFFGCSKYPACTYITNKLPKKEGAPEEPEKPGERELETLGP